MAADTSESTAEKLTFTCASCGFECNYEYFGKKPPFSKSVVYVYYFFCPWFFIFLLPNVISACHDAICALPYAPINSKLQKTPQGNPKSFQADFPDYQHVE